MSTRREFVRTAAAAGAAALARPALLTAGGPPMSDPTRTPPAEVPADRPLRVLFIGDSLMWLPVAAMTRHLDRAFKDHDIVLSDLHLDGAAHQPMRDAVANRVDIHETIRRDTPADPSLSHREHRRGQRQ